MKKLLFCLYLLLPAFATAQLQVADIFTSNMVLQRNQPITIFGKGTPGTKISINFSGSTQETVVLPDATWLATFKKQKANSHPQALTVSDGKETIELKNLLIGDVWICSGQSNMEWPMNREMHFEEAIKNAGQPLIRLYNTSFAGKNIYNQLFSDSVRSLLNKNDFYKGKWQECDSNTFKTMSAVAYYFGKSIAEETNVPIGLINYAIGGAPIETFISKEALQNHPEFSKKLSGNWLYNNHLPEWIRERGLQNLGNNNNGFGDELGMNHAFKPGFAYEAGIETMLPMPVKGIIWYQGESNAQETERVKEYRELQKLLIENYRNSFHQPNMPFYYVQLSSIDTAKYRSALWPEFRNEQRLFLNEVKHTGMAVSTDIGFKNDVHPTNKKDVGERLARWALRYTYKKKQVLPSGPLPVKARYKNGEIIIQYKFTGMGLHASGDTLKGFSLNGIEEVEAVIQKDKIIIQADEKPTYLFYGWKPYTEANLVNSENLPASGFKLRVR